VTVLAANVADAPFRLLLRDPMELEADAFGS
jgi:hypothetical protein